MTKKVGKVKTMKRVSILVSVLVMVIVLSFSAHAALVDMHDGTIYDTGAYLSWLKDANAGGLKTWDQAVAWAESLNSGSGFAGLTGWRLPNADPACGINYNCTNSEMGHLYYTELRNTAGGAGGSLTNTGPFINLQASFYWSGTEYAPNSAWYFLFNFGYQNAHDKGYSNYAWAVRPGARLLIPKRLQ
jgi:hypothetical protein